MIERLYGVQQLADGHDNPSMRATIRLACLSELPAVLQEFCVMLEDAQRDICRIQDPALQAKEQSRLDNIKRLAGYQAEVPVEER